MTWVRSVLTLLAIAVTSSTAWAERIAVGDVHAEDDVADEAGAVSLLVRSALAGSDRTLVELPKGITLASAAGALAKAGADHALLIELSRDGTALRATVVVVSGGGAPAVTLVRAGDGEVQALAAAIVAETIKTLHLEPASHAAGSLGKLRPYAAAVRLRERDPAAAAASLGDAVPLAAASVPAVVPALKDLAANVKDSTLAVVAARGIGDAPRLDALAGAGDTTAKAFAAIQRSDLRAANAVALPKSAALVPLLRATLAESGSDDKKLGELLVAGLGSEQARAVLALASTIAPARLAPEVHKKLIAAAGAASPGVASLIGLNAAEAKVEVASALALISARELDAYELERLRAVLGEGTDATTLRLRAELAMRVGDGKDGPAIEAFAAAAPTDARAQRYLGWLLMERGKYGDAAAAFAKAGMRSEQARALLLANDPKGALAALGRAPSSPEELVIAARAALAEGKLDAALTALAQAEQLAPVNPLIHAAVIDFSAQRPDAARVPAARLVLDRGVRNGKLLLALEPAKPRPAEVKIDALGSGSAAGSAADAQLAVKDELDVKALEPLLEALPELPKLRRLTLVEAKRDENGWFTLRSVDRGLLGNALAKRLAAPPYKLKVTLAGETLDMDHITPEALAQLASVSDAVLVYTADKAAGTDADVSLMLYVRGATTVSSITNTVAMRGLVVWKRAKIIVLAVCGVIGLLLLILWLTRGMGKIKVDIDRPVDLVDEALCIEISRNAVRPRIKDLDEFYAKTKRDGMHSTSRSATLFTKGTFKVTLGTWYVHLYGAYVRGARVYPVPEECTKEVTVERGSHHDITFDLTVKLAELTVIIESEPREGVAVYADDGPRVHTDKQGVAVLMLPVGAHTIYLEQSGGQRVEKQMQIVSAKLHRLGVNVARELRHAGGIQLDSAASGQFTLELPQEKPVSSFARTQAATNPVAPSAAAPAPAPANNTATNGLLLGRYRLLGELGRGAMGVVHRARDEKLERDVAIKEMAGELRTNQTALQLFSQEAKALAQLNHTNIVAMYDQVTDERGIYMIMEMVDGTTLEHILAERGALPWPEAIAVVDQLCAGLAYAHARKVIHRDIKPGNIFIARDDTVKLGDFGLARVLREVTIRKTEVRGTPLYMAPEQITGTDVNHRADLYAVGCTLFELVCGRPPFIDNDILYAQLHNAPPVPSSLEPSLPPELDALILELIAKNPLERPSSAAEVRETLTKLMRG
jgi:tRNA A-37 threonylcarbamoyl transferase component Bud32/tetratricopeptide (TPR) repeat protein